MAWARSRSGAGESSLRSWLPRPRSWPRAEQRRYPLARSPAASGCAPPRCMATSAAAPGSPPSMPPWSPPSTASSPRSGRPRPTAPLGRARHARPPRRRGRVRRAPGRGGAALGICRVARRAPPGPLRRPHVRLTDPLTQDLSTAELEADLRGWASQAPQKGAGRPRLVRGIPVPAVAGLPRGARVSNFVDVISIPNVWMHRIDIARAIGRPRRPITVASQRRCARSCVTSTSNGSLPQSTSSSPGRWRRVARRRRRADR